MNKGGAPKGNQNAKKGAMLSSRLRKRLEERAKQDEIVDQLIDKACEGDLSAIKEIFDRLDGKPKQSIDLESNNTHQYVISDSPMPTVDEWVKEQE